MSTQHNLVTLVNSASIKKNVVYNGKPHTVVTSKTLPFDVVMNGILYTKEQILANYQKLDGTLAPIGHPKDSAGKFISAKTAEGINLSHVGAWNRNPKIIGNRVEIETWIDNEVAGRTAEGRELLERIEKGDPISTSVAVLANKIEQKGKNYSGIADIVDMDHNAILLNEPPACGIDQGVGLLVNTAEAVDVDNGQDNAIIKALESFKSYFLNQKEETKMEEELKKAKEEIAELKAKLAEKEGKKDEAEIKANEQITALNEKVDNLTNILMANANAGVAEKRKKVAVILGNEEVVATMDEKALDAIIARSGADHKLLPNSHQGGNKDEMSAEDLYNATFGGDK